MIVVKACHAAPGRLRQKTLTRLSAHFHGGHSVYDLARETGHRDTPSDMKGTTCTDMPDQTPYRAQDDRDGPVMAYPATSLIGDGIRVGFGLLVSLVILVVVPTGNGVWWFMMIVLALSLIVLVRTLLLLATRIRMTQDGLVAWAELPRGRTVPLATIPWDEMTVFKVRNYAERTFKAPFWVEITLKGPGRLGRTTIKTDQRLVGFQDLLEAAWAQAVRRRLVLDRTTLANLTALTLHGRIARPVRDADGENADGENADGDRP